MSKSFICPSCHSEVFIADFQNHYWNECSGEVLHQCQIDWCMQLLPTCRAMYEHAREVHPDISFYEKAYVMVSDEVASALRNEFFEAPAQNDLKIFELAEDSAKTKEDAAEPDPQVDKIILPGENKESCKEEKITSMPKKCEEIESLGRITRSRSRFLKNPYLKTDCCGIDGQMEKESKISCKDTFSEKKRLEVKLLKSRMEKAKEPCNSSNMQQDYEIESTSYLKFKKLPCPHENCDAKFARKAGLTTHLNRMHPSPMKYSDENCNELINPAYLNLKKQCRICEEWILISSLGDHCKNCKYCCSYEGCNATFTNKKKRLKHYRRHSLTVKCTYENCNSFVLSCNLSRHIRTVHEKLDTYCNKCKKWLPNCIYYDHNENCHGIEEKRFQCTHRGCNVTFAHEKSKFRHLKNKHPFLDSSTKCSWKNCGKFFASLSNLNRHAKEVHKNAGRRKLRL